MDVAETICGVRGSREEDGGLSIERGCEITKHFHPLK